MSPPSLERRGVGAYVHSRLLRLGIPLAAFILLWPLLEYLLFRIVGAETESYWGRLLRTDEPLQSGPVWFVGALLVYSLAYAGWCSCDPTARPPDRATYGPATCSCWRPWSP